MRQHLPFRAVNRRGCAQYDPAMQRHHLLPLQLVGMKCFRTLSSHVGGRSRFFDDFRANGMLLPAREDAVLRTALPLHRGPHRDYNGMVIERVGAIEATWSRARVRSPDAAAAEAWLALTRLQNELRLMLLDRRRVLRLNRSDPLGGGADYTELDALAEELWRATG